MARCVLDASALVAFLLDEEGARNVEELLMDEQGECLVHAINVCEVYYHFVAKFGVDRTLAALDELRPLIEVREDLDEPLWRKAGDLKVFIQRNSTERGSIADGFCAALALREQCDVVTTDHSGFGPLSRGGRCRVKFLR